MTKIPGVAWISLLAFGSAWLSQYMGNYVWVPTAIVVLGAVGKGLEVVYNTPPAPTSRGMVSADYATTSDKVGKWLLGG